MSQGRKIPVVRLVDDGGSREPPTIANMPRRIVLRGIEPERSDGLRITVGVGLIQFEIFDLGTDAWIESGMTEVCRLESGVVPID